MVKVRLVTFNRGAPDGGDEKLTLPDYPSASDYQQASFLDGAARRSIKGGKCILLIETKETLVTAS